MNNDLQKAEGEFKTAVKLDPDSEEAVTTLAISTTTKATLRTRSKFSVPSRTPRVPPNSIPLSAAPTSSEGVQERHRRLPARHSLDRDNLDAIRGLAENLMNDGQTDASLEQYKVIADANPEDAQTYVRMAEIYRARRQVRSRTRKSQEADTLVHDTIDVPYNMAAVYQAQGRYDEAAQTFAGSCSRKRRRARTATSQAERNNRAIFIERLGTVYREQENYTAAVDTFRKMLALGDENARSGYQQIIDTYREAKQWQQATAVAKEAVQKLPNDRDLRMVLRRAARRHRGVRQGGGGHVAAMLKGGRRRPRRLHHAWPISILALKRWDDAAATLSTKPNSFPPSPKTRNMFIPARRPLPAPENVRSGRSEFRKVLATTSPTDPQNAADAQLSRLHAG